LAPPPKVPCWHSRYTADEITGFFAAANYEGPLDDEIFAGLWDNLPGLEALGVHPPALPAQGPRVHVLPHRAPQIVINQPVQVGAQAGPGQNQLPAVPARPHNQWNFGPLGPAMAPGGAQLFQDLPRQSPRAANPVPPAPPLSGNQPVVDQWQRFQQQIGGGNPRAPPQTNMGPHVLAREARQQMLRAMDGEIARRVGDQNQRLDAAIPAQPGVPAVAGGRVGRNAGRGAARPLNPPNGQT
jgi:hypothetical protein